MKFDDILEYHVGEFGPYQKWIYFLACVPVIASAIFTMIPVFIIINPEYRCQIPGLENDTFVSQNDYHQTLINATIPTALNEYGKTVLSQCEFYNLTGQLGLASDGLPMIGSTNHSGNVSHIPVLHHPDNHTGSDVLSVAALRTKQKCNQWVFEDIDYTSAVEDFRMICSNFIRQSHFKSISFYGTLIGGLITGVLADVFGRKCAFLMCLVLTQIASLVHICLPIYEVFLAMRLLEGIGIVGVYIICFVYVVEMVGPNYRMFAGIFIDLFWCVGLFLLVGTAYITSSWKSLMLVICLPWSLLLLYAFLIPESPRWLISVGKIKKADKILQRIAKTNNNKLPEKLLEKSTNVGENGKHVEPDPKKAGPIWTLFTTKTLLFRFLIIVFNRFSLNVNYFGISINVEHLSGNLYLNFTLSSAVETLSRIGVLLLINRFGRKALYCGGMIIGTAGLLTSVLPIFFGKEDDLIYSVALVMVGKFGITGAYSVIAVFGSEMFPTDVRNSAMGMALAIGIFGGVVSSYIFDLANSLGGQLGEAIPMLVLGTLSLLACLSTLLLPETRNRRLPDTVEDAIIIGGE